MQDNALAEYIWGLSTANPLPHSYLHTLLHPPVIISFIDRKTCIGPSARKSSHSSPAKMEKMKSSQNAPMGSESWQCQYFPFNCYSLVFFLGPWGPLIEHSSVPPPVHPSRNNFSWVHRWAETLPSGLRQGCINCGILVSGIRARGVSSEHMENMEMFSCSPT